VSHIHIEGTAQFQQLADRLKAAADRDLRKQVGASLRKVAKPIGQRVLEKGAESMPHKGGLSAKIGKGKVGVRAGLTGRQASVSLLLKAGGYDLNPLDRGQLRHPVFGNKKSWVRQSVPSGRFTAAFEAEAPKARAEVLKAVNDTLNDAARGL
jgi:hypothetical protein